MRTIVGNDAVELELFGLMRRRENELVDVDEASVCGAQAKREGRCAVLMPRMESSQQLYVL